MKRFLLALAVVAAVAMPAAAPATIYSVTVTNTTAYCAWITPYWSNALTTWHIMNPPGNPRSLEPGKSYRFPISGRDQLKVRAEVFTNEGSCAGGKRADLEIRRDAKHHSHEDFNLELRGDHRGFGFHWI